MVAFIAIVANLFKIKDNSDEEEKNNLWHQRDDGNGSGDKNGRSKDESALCRREYDGYGS